MQGPFPDTSGGTLGDSCSKNLLFRKLSSFAIKYERERLTDLFT